MNPALVLVVLDRIFHKVGKGQTQLCLVHLRHHWLEVFHDKLHLFLVSDGF